MVDEGGSHRRVRTVGRTLKSAMGGLLRNVDFLMLERMTGMLKCFYRIDNLFFGHENVDGDVGVENECRNFRLSQRIHQRADHAELHESGLTFNLDCPPSNSC